MYVKAYDCIKDKVTGCYRVEPLRNKVKTNQKKQKTSKQEKETPTKTTKIENKIKEPKITRLERKQKYNELKRTLQKEWSTEIETEESDHDPLSAPSHFKRYTIQERKIVLQQPKRDQPKLGESYDGPENSKKIDLAREGEEMRPVWIASNLEPEEERLLVETLKEHRDVFA